MQEALTLFDSICNSRWFVKTSIVCNPFRHSEDLVSTILLRFYSSTRLTCSLKSSPDHPWATTSPTTLAGLTTTQLASISSNALSVSTRVRQRSRSMRTIRAPQIRTRFDVRLVIAPLKKRSKKKGSSVVLNAISDILLQIHLRECGLL